MILDIGGVYMLWSFCLFISNKSALSGVCVRKITDMVTSRFLRMSVDLEEGMDSGRI